MAKNIPSDLNLMNNNCGMDSRADTTSSPDLRAGAAFDDLSPAAGTSCAEGAKVAEQDAQDRRPEPAKPEPRQERHSAGKWCKVEGCKKYHQGRHCQGYCRSHYKEIVNEICRVEGCAECAQHRCEGYCRSHFNETVKSETADQADKWTMEAPTCMSSEGSFDGDDAALALALQQQEREQYRRGRAATKVERFEPGGNPNVLDYGASAEVDEEAPVDNSSTKRKAESSLKSEGVPSPAQSSADCQMDQEAADAALAAQLAAMYANPAFSSATEKVKFGGRRREGVKHFEPGGDPRETNPTGDYNLPPVPPSTIEGDETSPKRPKILTRKPGRLSKEEADRLMAAEEATQARLRDLMEGFDKAQKKDEDDGEVDDEGDHTVPIHMSMMDLLAKPRRIAVDGRPTTVSVKCTPAVLDLTEGEALEIERQLKELFGMESEDAIQSIGCVLSLTYDAKKHDSDGENNIPKEQNGHGRGLDFAAYDSVAVAAILSMVFESYVYLLGGGDGVLPIASPGQSERVALADLTERFMEYHSAFPVGSLVDIVGVTKQLKMEPRRVFDILDVLCALNVVQKAGKENSSFKWNGTSALCLFLAGLQQEAFRVYETEAKASGMFDQVANDFALTKTNDHESIMPSLGNIAVELLMIVLVQDGSITIADANERLNGLAANNRSKKRLNEAITILCGLDIVCKGNSDEKNIIEWSFHASRADLPGLLRRWPTGGKAEVEENATAFCPSAEGDASIPPGIVPELPAMATHMVLFESDNDHVVTSARAKASKSGNNDALARSIGDDLVFWDSQCPSSDQDHRCVAFLHRLMRPMLLRTSGAIHESDTGRGSVKVMDFSLLQVLLQCPLVQPHFVDGVVRRLQRLLQNYSLTIEGLNVLLVEALGNAVSCTGTERYALHRLRLLSASFFGPARDALVDTILGAFSGTIAQTQLCEMFSSFADAFPLEPIAISVRRPEIVLPAPENLTFNCSRKKARSRWAKSCKDQLAVGAERKRLIRSFEASKSAAFVIDNDPDSPRRSTRPIIPRDRPKDGALIFSENELTLEKFIERKRIMGLVNKTFTRDYIEGVSKPALSQLNLAAEDVKQLQSIFFDDDGSLRDEMKLEIDSGMKNDPRYIVFSNVECIKERKDRRWQVPIRHHGIGSEITSRRRVEDVMTQRNILLKGAEELDDIGLLFGGMEDQSLHHDTARQFTTWMPNRPLAEFDDMVELDAITGWEVDRLEYNDAMASPAAPGSLLVGLHSGDYVYLGVQKDQILRLENGTCKIKNGRDEVFPIVRENDHLVVVEVKRGVMFPGDFPHAGVRNFSADSEEQRLMDQLVQNIADINKRYTVHEQVLRTKATVEMMSNFPGLNKLCRLHCSTKMIKGGILVPSNSVGFDGCLPNEPDRRCLESDAIEEEEDAAFSLPSSSALPNIVSKKEVDMSPSYEGKRVSKHYGGELNYGTVIEHEVNGKSALIRFDDGDFEMVRLPELKNMARLHNEEKGADDIVRANSKKRERGQLDDEGVSVASNPSGQLFWKRHTNAKEILVRAKCSGKAVASGRATLPKATSKPLMITKVAKLKNGIRVSGKVKGFNQKTSIWKVKFSWGEESWSFTDVKAGFLLYRSGFFKRKFFKESPYGAALKRCAVQACNKRAQGPRTNHMCAAHFTKLGGDRID